MATNVTIDQILDAVVDAISVLVPSTGTGIVAARPLHFVKRYMGELSTPEAQQRGAVGRTPCAFVAHERTRYIRTTISRRVDRVETTIAVFVCSDAWRDRNDRSVLFAPAEMIKQAVIGARRLGLAIQPFKYSETVKMIDHEKLLMEAVRFTTRHRVDYTTEANYDRMLEVEGEVHLVDEDGNNVGNETPLHIVFP